MKLNRLIDFVVQYRFKILIVFIVLSIVSGAAPFIDNFGISRPKDTDVEPYLVLVENLTYWPKIVLGSLFLIGVAIYYKRTRSFIDKGLNNE